MRSKIRERFFKFLFGILILGLLIYKVGIDNLIYSLVELKKLYLIPVWISLLSMILIGNLNLKLLFGVIKPKLRFFKLLRYYLLSWSSGLIIPGKLGQFSLIYFLRREKIKLGQSSAVLLLDMIITMVSLCLISIVGFLLFFEIGSSLKVFFLVFACFVGIYFLFFSHFGRKSIKKVLGKRSEKFKGFSKTMSLYLHNKKGLLFINFLITLIKWGINALFIYLLFLAYNQTINFFIIIPITAVIVLVSFIPITISGLGVRESLAVLIYGSLGIDAAVILSVFLIILALKYLTALFCAIFLLKGKDIG